MEQKDWIIPDLISLPLLPWPSVTVSTALRSMLEYSFFHILIDVELKNQTLFTGKWWVCSQTGELKAPSQPKPFHDSTHFTLIPERSPGAEQGIGAQPQETLSSSIKDGPW